MTCSPTAASPTVMRIHREVAETEITGRRTEAGVNFEEPGRGGPGYRSLDEESVDQRSETNRTDQESLAKRGEIDAYPKRIQWRAWALMGMEISWVPNTQRQRDSQRYRTMERDGGEFEGERSHFKGVDECGSGEVQLAGCTRRNT